jgi:hypothetical protein
MSLNIPERESGEKYVELSSSYWLLVLRRRLLRVPGLLCIIGLVNGDRIGDKFTVHSQSSTTTKLADAKAHDLWLSLPAPNMLGQLLVMYY